MLVLSSVWQSPAQGQGRPVRKSDGASVDTRLPLTDHPSPHLLPVAASGGVQEAVPPLPPCPTASLSGTGLYGLLRGRFRWVQILPAFLSSNRRSINFDIGLVPLRRLQYSQSNWRFSLCDVPPCFRGMMWSM